MTWDVISTVAEQSSFFGKIVPGVGAFINYAEIAEEISDATYTRPVYKPFEIDPYHLPALPGLEQNLSFP